MTAAIRMHTAAVRWRPVRRHLSAMRRKHRERSLGVRFSAGYEWLLYLFVGGGVVVAGVRSAVGTVANPPPALAPWLGATAILIAVAALTRGLVAVGPLVVGPAYASWLLTSPVDRAQLLARRAVTTIAAAALLGAGTAGLVTFSAGSGSWLAIGIGCGTAVAFIAALTVAAEPRPRWAAATAAAARVLLVAALLGAAYLVVAARVALPVPSAPPVPEPATAAVGGAVLGVLTVVAAVSAARSLGAMDVQALTAGNSLVAAASVGTSTIDGTILNGVLQERRLRDMATVRSRRHRHGRRRALLEANLHAALRSRTAWGWSTGLVLVPYLADLMAPPTAVPVAQLAGATLVAARFAGSLRAVVGSSALRRSLGGRDRELTAVHCVVPFLAAAAWTLAVAAAGGNPLSLILLPISALVVVLRHVTRPERSYTSTLLDTPFGTLPVETIRDVSRGPLLFLVLAGVQIILQT